MIPSRKTRRPGFTMVELIVILAFLALLLGLLIPAVQKVREAAARAQCSNNLRQIGIAMHNCHDAYRLLPPLVGSFPANFKSHGTLFYFLLPFIEQDNLYKVANGYVWNNRVYSFVIPTYLCPADPTAPANNLYRDWLATCNYPGNWLVFGKGGASFSRTFTDGTSNTIVFTERYQLCRGQPCAWGYPGLYYWSPMFAHYSHGKFQTRPSAARCNPSLAQGPHTGGIMVGMGDASCRLVPSTLSPQTWWYACTPNGGEVLGEDWNN
jgi:type II secretory pathway pseudopilin PulG